MPLQVAKPPPEALEIASATLAEIGRAESPFGTLFGDLSGASLSLALPHPVYVMTRGDFEGSDAIGHSRQSRWRFLVLNGERAIGGIEVRIDSATGQARFAGADAGWIAAETAEVVQSVERRLDLEDRDLEVRLLQAPEFYVVAVWLKNLTGHDDLFLPLAPAPKRFVPRRLYADDEFLALLREEAAAHPVFDSSPRLAVSAG